MENLKDLCKQSFFHYNTAYTNLSSIGIHRINQSQAHTREYETTIVLADSTFYKFYSKNAPHKTELFEEKVSEIPLKERTKEKINKIADWVNQDFRLKTSQRNYNEML